MYQPGSYTIPKQLLLSDEYFPGTAPRVLLAEADHVARRLLKNSLNKCGYSVIECTHGVELMIHLGTLAAAGGSEKVDLIISDVRMPGIKGIEIFERIRKENGYPPVILISSSTDKAHRNKARRIGALPIFSDPSGVEHLLIKVMKIVPSGS